MPKIKKQHSRARPAFERSGDPAKWLPESPLVCDAIRMEPEKDPWDKARREDTEKRRKKISEISINVEHYLADESGAT